MDKIKNDPNSLSLFLNMTNLISTIHPKVLAWIIVDGLLGSANIMVNIYIPKIVIDFIVGRTYIDSFVVLVLGLFIVKLCLYYFAELATKKSEDERIIFNRKLLAHFSHKANKISYPYLESPESLELKEAARAPIIYGTIWKILSDLSSIVVSLFTIIGIVLILIRFSLALFALVTILSLISVIIESRLIQALIDIQKQFIPLNTRYNYYFDQFYDEEMVANNELYRSLYEAQAQYYK